MTTRTIKPNLQAHDDVAPIEMFPGVSRRTLNAGGRTSIHEIQIAEGCVVPMHTHPHEQIGYLVAGTRPLRTRRRDEGTLGRRLLDHPLRGPHTKSTALEDAVALDIFSPAREEYIP